ncbi:MAG: hypothetical protein ACP5TY_00280 [Thermodesulforhabdaceae bacterium]
MNDGQFLSSACHFSSPGKRYLLCAAIPEEYTSFLNISGPWEKVKTTPFKLFQSCKATHTLYFIPTGMGIRKIAPYWQHIIKHVKPDLVISFGFCGEVIRPTRKKLFLSACFQPLPPNEFFKASEQPLSSSILEFCALNKVGIAATISTPVFLPKRHIPELIYNRLAPKEADKLTKYQLIMDMESSLIASLAVRTSVPFLSIRASTDSYDEEIPFDVEELLNRDGFVSVSKAVALLRRDQSLIKAFWRFWKSSRQASVRLATLLTNLFALPPSVLQLSPPKFRNDY